MVRIHLGIICGNEEDNIVRFLDSFQPHFDSVSVVRAVGARAPDKSLDIAKSRGCRAGEYRNAPAAAEWDHVDNFAAARSQSFALAPEGTDWIMWADCDDLLTDSAHGLLRGLRAGQDAKGDVIYAPYVTNASGSYARRARLVKASAYRRWVNAVHEDIEHDPSAVLVWSPELQVVHMPANNKRNSPARNRRILEAVPEDERSGREWWFLFRECEVQSDIPNAIRAAVMATGRDDLGDEEKFVAYQTIGRYIRDVAEAERPLLEALRLMPHRREGYAELAKLHIARGSGKKALAYANAMEAQEMPDDPSWTHDASLFGWRAHDLKALALSKAGRDQESERLRREWRKRLLPRIAVGHPAGRGQKDIDVRQMWLERAAKPERVAYYFGICESDTEIVQQLQHYPHGLAPAVPAGYSSAVANYNAAATAATSCGARIFVMAQSDVYPPHGWDEQIVQAMAPHMDRPTVLHVSDGFRGPKDPLMTIMCFNWRWWLGREWLLCPEYDGYWSDTEFSFRAYEDGVVQQARHIQFYHDHPAFTGAQSDEVYMRQQNLEACARGKAVFARRNPEAAAKGW
jgi:hypothetical protein